MALNLFFGGGGGGVFFPLTGDYFLFFGGGGGGLYLRLKRLLFLARQLIFAIPRFPASCPEQYFTFSWAAREADWFD